MGVTLERVQNKFACIIGELCSEPDILSQFAIWVDLRIAEYKAKGSISLECSGEDPNPTWLRGFKPPGKARERTPDRHHAHGLERVHDHRHARGGNHGVHSPVQTVSEADSWMQQSSSERLSEDRFSPEVTFIKDERVDADEIFPVSMVRSNVGRKRPSGAGMGSGGSSDHHPLPHSGSAPTKVPRTSLHPNIDSHQHVTPDLLEPVHESLMSIIGSESGDDGPVDSDHSIANLQDSGVSIHAVTIAQNNSSQLSTSINVTPKTRGDNTASHMTPATTETQLLGHHQLGMVEAEKSKHGQGNGAASAGSEAEPLGGGGGILTVLQDGAYWWGKADNSTSAKPTKQKTPSGPPVTPPVAVQSKPSGPSTRPTQNESTVQETSAFASRESLLKFIQRHPKTCHLTNFRVTNQRIKLVDAVGSQMVLEYGYYPTKDQKYTASCLLASLTGLSSTVFYDMNLFQGFLEMKLVSLRRKLPPEQKQFTWRKKHKQQRHEASAPAARVESAGDAECLGRQSDCPLCQGICEEDAKQIVTKMAGADCNNLEEILVSAAKTFCYRRSQIKKSQRSFNQLVREVPKYKTFPEIVLKDFLRLHGESTSGAFLKEFPNTVKKVVQLCGEEGQKIALQNLSIKATKHGLESTTSLLCVVQACLHLMPVCGRGKMTPEAALSRLILILPANKPVESALLQFKHPRLILQDDKNPKSHKHAYSVAYDGVMCKGMPSLLESLDLLFKFYWVFNVPYPTGLQHWFKFLQFAVYGFTWGTGAMPSRIHEIKQLLDQYELEDT